MKLSFGKKKDGPPEKESVLPVVEERDKQAPPSVISLIEQVNAESDLPWPNFFRPSMVFGCDRQNVYHYAHAKETPAQKGPKLRRILDTGTALHTMHQNYLANHKDIFFVPEPKLSVRLGGKKAHVRGSCDGLIIRRSDGYRFVIELKTISKEGFDSLRAPKKEHIKQAMIYARLIGVHWIMFVYICKSSSNMKEYAIPAIDSQWDDFVERVTGLMKHVENKTLPMYDRNTCNIQFCNYVGQCRKDGAPVLEKRLRMTSRQKLNTALNLLGAFVVALIFLNFITIVQGCAAVKPACTAINLADMACDYVSVTLKDPETGKVETVQLRKSQLTGAVVAATRPASSAPPAASSR